MNTTKKIDFSKVQRNGKALENFIDKYWQLPGGQEIVEEIEQHEVDMMMEALESDLSWLDYEFGDNDYQLLFELVQEIDDFQTSIELIHVNSMYCTKKAWAIKESREYISVFLGTGRGISEEIELQADDGSLVYHYIGHNYFEVWLSIDKQRLTEYFFNLGIDLIDDLSTHKEFKHEYLYDYFSLIESIDRNLALQVFDDFTQGQKKALMLYN